MHDSVNIDRSVTRGQIRKANDCINEAKNIRASEALFDAFWREGELALLFGEAATGKSLLAVQLAESLARGRPIEGFAMPERRRKVLYVDLKLSDIQFGRRYEAPGETAKSYKLSENFYRGRPPSSDEIADWLRETIAANGFRVVVIDDLSALRQTCDGTRETLPFMRELRRITDELGVSILVISGSRAPRRGVPVSEADLLRSCILCDVADSVFATAKNPRVPGSHYIVQTRSRSAAIVWNDTNPPMFTIARGDDGFLGLEFDGRFRVPMDEETAWLIFSVKHRRECGASFRLIAEDLGISKTKACRLIKKWTPEIQRYFDDRLARDEQAARDEEAARICEAPRDVVDTSAPEEPVPELSQPLPDSPEPSGQADDKPPDRLAHLKRSFDGYGNEIFVESEDYRGKPLVHYKFDSNNRLTRVVKKGYSNICTLVDDKEEILRCS